MVTASVLTIGDEILIGQIVDTNSAMIARRLNKIGVKVRYISTCGDNRKDILSSLRECLKSTDIVIATGGLGPTKDDITKQVLFELSESKRWIESKEQLAIIKKILRARKIEFLKSNLAQATVPQSCRVIINKIGTAPVMEFEFSPKRFGRKNLLFSMPGVPYETESALPDVIDSISKHYKLSKICHKTICTFGTPESVLSDQISKWEASLPKNLHLAYLPNPVKGVRLRLSIYGTTEAAAKSELQKYTRSLKRILGSTIYGYGETSLQEAIGKLLLKKHATLSTAESCTGGLIAHLITEVPGASRYFLGSVVSYDNSVKRHTLGVTAATLKNHGAVSEECVRQMAKGVRERLATTYSVATSGIAGPGGGTAEKPVGTLWIAVAGPQGVCSRELASPSTRKVNIERFASAAMDFLRRCIMEDKI